MAKSIREPACIIPVMGQYDVVVLGGGPAGIGAAVAAARAKAKVLLVEQTGCMGGMSTSGMVPVFAPLGHTDRPAIAGIIQEVIDRLKALDGLGRNDDTMAWIPIDLEKLKFVFDQMVAQAGAKVLFFTQFAGVRKRGRRVSHVILQNKSGRQAVAAKMFIDATGDADVAAAAGVPFEKGDSNGRTQPVGVCYTATGIDLPVYREFIKSIGSDRVGWWLHLQESGAIPAIPKAEYRGVYPFEVTPCSVGVNFAHIFEVDACDARDLSRAVLAGRKMAHSYIDYARKNIPGMKNARIVATASLAGVRESRRIEGRGRLTIDDFKNARHHADDIACYDYPIDVHNATPSRKDIRKFQNDFDHLVMAPGKTYGIPFSCLLPRTLDNLAVAGRCLSADREMHGSVRVMPACFAMGQAAGQATAIAAKRNVPLYKVDIRDLQKKLSSAGVRLT